MPFFQNSMQGICEEASAHDYDVIDCDTVWETITEEIPALRKRLQVILEHMGEEE